MPEQFAPISTYIVLAITLTTFSWIKPEGMWGSRSLAAAFLILLEWGHIASFIIRDPLKPDVQVVVSENWELLILILGNADRVIHGIILFLYIVVFGSLYRNAIIKFSEKYIRPPTQTPSDPTLSSE